MLLDIIKSLLDRMIGVKKKLVIFLFIAFTLGCSQNQTYQPEGLRKLTAEERIERAKNKILVSESVVFKNHKGRIVSNEEIQQMNPEKFVTDQYVDKYGSVVEIVIKPATKEEKLLADQIRQAIRESMEEEEKIALIDVDCAKVKEILEDVYDKDQAVRQGNSKMGFNVDKENQQKVVSIIEHCGFPNKDEHGSKSVNAVFLVIQHANKNLREKYFPLIKKSAEKGDLEWSMIALMEDRMLVDVGQKQKYGTQVRQNTATGEWEVYPIENAEHINQRRADVGLGPIEEYLSKWDIDFK